MLINFKQVEAILNKSYLIATGLKGMRYAIAMRSHFHSHMHKKHAPPQPSLSVVRIFTSNLLLPSTLCFLSKKNIKQFCKHTYFRVARFGVQHRYVSISNILSFSFLFFPFLCCRLLNFAEHLLRYNVLNGS